MDHGDLRRGEPLGEALLGEVVHQEADGAAVHAVDRLARVHEPMQGLQHEAVAAERDDDVGGLGIDIAVARDEPSQRLLRLRDRARDEGDPLIARGGRLIDMASRSAAADAAAGRGEDGARGFRLYDLSLLVEAEQAGRAIVERRLCACVNILPGMISHYWWQGTLERGEEVVMIIKTRASLAEAVHAAVKEMHSYTTPAILVIPLESVDQNYLAWIMAETEAGLTRPPSTRGVCGERAAALNRSPCLRSRP